jgi:hypothetical protein
MASSTSSRMVTSLDRRCRFSSARFPYPEANIFDSKAYVSFGGLLLALEGPYKKLTPLRVDYLYMLIKK